MIGLSNVVKAVVVLNGSAGAVRLQGDGANDGRNIKAEDIATAMLPQVINYFYLQMTCCQKHFIRF